MTIVGTVILHKIKDVRVVRASPDNHNMTMIDIVKEDGNSIRLELYRVEKPVMLRLLAGMGDVETEVRVNDRTETVTDYLTTEKVIGKMEGTE